MKSLLNFITINEAEFCKPDDICYIVVDKDNNKCCTYLPYTGFGDGEQLKSIAEKMAKSLGNDHKVIEVKFKDIK
jgi:hypothetical protein